MALESAERVSRGHLPSLDGVRGLAILMVVCTHLFVSNTVANGPVVQFLGNLCNYGFFGVDLFFVLSGFLITGVLVDSLDDPGYFSKFYSRRALRIFPLYYGVLLLLFALTPLLGLQWKGLGWLLLGYVQNFRPDQLSTFYASPNINLTHFWSLAVEEQFYLLWPAMVFLLRDRRRILVAIGSISVGALLLRVGLMSAGASPNLIRMSTFTRADTLLLGAALALLYRSGWWPRVLRAAPYSFTVAALAIAASIHLFSSEFLLFPTFSQAMRYWIYGPRFTLLAIASACLIAWSLAPGSMCKRFFELPAMRFFGRYSYGIYVLHMVMLPLLIRTLRAEILRLTQSKLLSVAGAGILVFALSVVAAMISFHFYEKPFLRLKRYFAYLPKRAMPRAAQEVPVGALSLHLVDSKSSTHEVSLR